MKWHLRVGLMLPCLLAATLPGCSWRPALTNQAPPAVFNPMEPYRIRTHLESRAVTQENPTGAPGLGGKGRGNGNLRKGAPALRNVRSGETRELCNIQGPGMIRHLWMTMQNQDPPLTLRNHILRIYWDDAPSPAVEAPVGDFFGVAHGRTASFMTPWVGMPEGRSFHCYFPMPFSRRCRITVENDTDKADDWIFYQVDYTLGDRVTGDMGRFHAHFRRQTWPVGKDYVLLDTQGSPGVYVGAVLGVNPIGPGGWGEGEMKFYIDGDTQYPTICGTGTEDYICDGWGMWPHQALYTGMNSVIKDPKTGWDRFISFYRFHVMDPIYFKTGLRVELQQMGCGELTEENIKKYGWVGPHVHPGLSSWLYDRSDDWCSTVFWYQQPTGKPLPTLPSRAERSRGLK